MRIVAKTVIMLLACLVVAAIAGNVLGRFLELTPLRDGKDVFPFVLWFVLGIIAGSAAYVAAGVGALPGGEDWSALPDGARSANLIVGACFATLFTLLLLFYGLYWRHGVAGLDFVPESAPHSMLFLASAAFAIAVARVILMPKAGK